MRIPPDPRNARPTALPGRVVRRLPRGLVIAVPLLVVVAFTGVVPARTAGPAAPIGDPVVAVAGDIACTPGKAADSTHCQQRGTGSLIVNSIHPNWVLPLGDSQYDSGTSTEYAGSYNVTGWGADKALTRPAAGNHEYRTTGATGYYRYFGTNAGSSAKGYYSYNIPGPSGAFHWHLIALNSECSVLGGGSISKGCGAGSSQETWLRSDLAANANVCTIAYWHRPRFSSSSTTPSSTTYVAFWSDLYAHGADIVLAGHAHDYERFAPQTSAGASDPTRGVTEFVVGTGGDGFQTMGGGIANSVVRNNNTFGVLRLTLHANSYDYQFRPLSGSFTDSGSRTCHTAPAPDTTRPAAPSAVTPSAPTTAGQVTVAWKPASDNVAVKNYNVYRATTGATPVLLDTTSTATTSFTDTSVEAATSYTYQVSAIDASGNVSAPSPESATITIPASTDSSAPNTPSTLEAEVVFRNEIDLGWSQSTDTGTGVSGYRVYRRAAGKKHFDHLATTIGTGPGHTSYVDLSVRPSTTYEYYITAYDGHHHESAPSATVSGTTWH